MAKLYHYQVQFNVVFPESEGIDEIQIRDNIKDQLSVRGLEEGIISNVRLTKVKSIPKEAKERFCGWL